MLSLPHLIVLFVIALMIFGPQKLPELARMLGKATAEFRKMTNDFRYALEDEVRDLERQTRIREEEIAAAARAAQTPTPMPAAVTSPEGAVPRDASAAATAVAFETQPAESQHDPLSGASLPPQVSSDPASSHTSSEPAGAPHEREKSSDDNSAV